MKGAIEYLGEYAKELSVAKKVRIANNQLI
jgi:hypothetical protein